MNRRRWLGPNLCSFLAAVTVFASLAQASPGDPSPPDHAPALKSAKIRGKWRIAWDVRLGTVRGILVLKQSGSQVTGTFEEYGHTYSLSGSIRGQVITFDIPFPGPRPYTIEFTGTIGRDKMTGTSALKGGGKAYLGHAGEVDEPERPWTATKGLKRPNDSPGKPPDNDDDDDHAPRPGTQATRM